jgi:hypothetical protein
MRDIPLILGNGLIIGCELSGTAGSNSEGGPVE